MFFFPKRQIEAVDRSVGWMDVEVETTRESNELRKMMMYHYYIHKRVDDDKKTNKENNNNNNKKQTIQMI